MLLFRYGVSESGRESMTSLELYQDQDRNKIKSYTTPGAPAVTGQCSFVRFVYILDERNRFVNKFTVLSYADSRIFCTNLNH